MDDDSERPRDAAASSEDLPYPVDPQALLASVGQLTGVGLWVHDPAAGETWWSDRAKALCGIDPTRAPAFPVVVDRHVQTGADAVDDAFDAAITDGDPFDVECEVGGAGTAGRTTRIRCRPHATGDGTFTLHGTVRDITDAVRREQRIEVLRQTSQRLNDADSRQAVAEIVADASKNILGLVNTTIRLVDRGDDTLRTVVTTEECVERAGERPDYAVGEATPAARTYRTGEPRIEADHEATDDDHDRGELRSGLYVPIGSHGVLSAGDVVVDAFDDRDLEAASLLGQLGAEAFTRIGLAKRSRAI